MDKIDWDEVERSAGWWDTPTRLALVKLAKSATLYSRPPDGTVRLCMFCGEVYPEHEDGCPVQTLEWV